MVQPIKDLFKAIRNAMRYAAHIAVMPVLAAVEGVLASLMRVKIELEKI